ncbi:MAG: hypothetical protein ACP5O1_03595 [Phycisphaerae bacterium]
MMIESNLLIVKDIDQWISSVSMRLLRQGPTTEYKAYGVAENSPAPFFRLDKPPIIH